MFVASTTAEIYRVPARYIEDVIFVFEGEMSCCRKCHRDQQYCDRETLVPTLLGLYFMLYTKQKTRKTTKAQGVAWCLMADDTDRVFPATFQYIGPQRTSTRRLF